jgi:hypothetical protein
MANGVVPKSWQLRIELSFAPLHPATFYGFKSREDPKLVDLINHFKNYPWLYHMEVRCLWKDSKYGRWNQTVENINLTPPPQL